MSKPVDLEALRAHFTAKIGGDRSLLPKDHESLVDEGILDSFGLAELSATIQETYGIAVSDEDLSLKNFETFDKIAAYIGKHS